MPFRSKIKYINVYNIFGLGTMLLLLSWFNLKTYGHPSRFLRADENNNINLLYRQIVG